MSNQAPSQLTLVESRRNQLSMLHKHRLMELIEQEYRQRAESDADFAAYASKRIGTEVSGNNVAGARVALGIPATFMRGRGRDVMMDELVADMAKLEQRVATIEAALKLGDSK